MLWVLGCLVGGCGGDDGPPGGDRDATVGMDGGTGRDADTVVDAETIRDAPSEDAAPDEDAGPMADAGCVPDPSCDDSMACTSDCRLGTVCMHVAADRDGDGADACNDCNDDDDTIFPGAEEVCDDIDNNCDDSIDEGLRSDWGPDCDGDGFVPGFTENVCAMPTTTPDCGTVAGVWIRACASPADTDCADPTSLDCNDANASVRPNQSSYFTVPIPGTSSYDYNCDGLETRRWTTMSPVTSCPMSCPIGELGWTGDVPDCGRRGAILACIDTGEGCTSGMMFRLQSCR